MLGMGMFKGIVQVLILTKDVCVPHTHRPQLECLFQHVVVCDLVNCTENKILSEKKIASFAC